VQHETQLPQQTTAAYYPWQKVFLVLYYIITEKSNDILYRLVKNYIINFIHFYRTMLCEHGICCHLVSVCLLPVCRMPVLYLSLKSIALPDVLASSTAYARLDGAGLHPSSTTRVGLRSRR